MATKEFNIQNLKEFYADLALNLKEVAAIFGVAPSTVRRQARRHLPKDLLDARALHYPTPKPNEGRGRPSLLKGV